MLTDIILSNRAAVNTSDIFCSLSSFKKPSPSRPALLRLFSGVNAWKHSTWHVLYKQNINLEADVVYLQLPVRHKNVMSFSGVDLKPIQK